MSNISLIGFMGSGKSTVGKLVSKELGWQYVDTDALIEQGDKLTIPEIFSFRGEIGFRQLEIEVHRELSLPSSENKIVGSGGGSVMNSLNMEYLRLSGEIVYLNVPLEVCRSRVLADSENIRPLAKDQVKFEKLFHLRAPLYRHYADLIVDSTSSQENAKKIVEWYRESH